MNGVRPKPEGSTIEELEVPGGVCLRWRPMSGGLLRYPVGGFLCVWLVFWVIGLVFAIGSLLLPDTFGANNGNPPPRGFLITWLTGWVVGGVFVCYLSYRILRPIGFESVTLTVDRFCHDQGPPSPLLLMNPWFAYRHADPFEAFRKFFGKRRVVDVAKTELGRVVFEQSGSRQRLYYDQGADRIEIAEYLREPEREWLAEVIADWQADPD